MKAVQITGWCARFIREQVQPGDICIDATMGNGNDTLLLSSLCGKDGHVFAFDIQEAALINTRKRLMEADAPQNYTLLLESHTNIEHYVDPGTVSCITFNLDICRWGPHQSNPRRYQHCRTFQKPGPSAKRRADLTLHLQWW